jgi:hypothetical protein
VHFGFHTVTALGAILPTARMLLIKVQSAQRVASMIPMATVAVRGEQHVLVLVIADPLITAFCFREMSRRAAQTAARLVRGRGSFLQRGRLDLFLPTRGDLLSRASGHGGPSAQNEGVVIQIDGSTSGTTRMASLRVTRDAGLAREIGTKRRSAVGRGILWLGN